MDDNVSDTADKANCEVLLNDEVATGVGASISGNVPQALSWAATAKVANENTVGWRKVNSVDNVSIAVQLRDRGTANILPRL